MPRSTSRNGPYGPPVFGLDTSVACLGSKPALVIANDPAVHRYCQTFQREPFALAPETVRRLMQHRYAGNVRELENIVKRMIVLDDPGLEKNALVIGFSADTAAPPVPTANPPAVSLKEIGRRAAQDAERAVILRMLEHTRWNRLRAAKLLNISYRALLYKIKAAGIGLKPSL